jgi:hypothetical protein
MAVVKPGRSNRQRCPVIDVYRFVHAGMTILKSPETELILTGALHLAGKDGLLVQLRQHGYKVEPF